MIFTFTNNISESMITPKKTPSAPPPLHTLVVFTLVVVIISLNLPTLASVDQIATSKNFQASPLLRSYQSHSATSNINQPLGLVRLLIAFTIAYVTISTIRLDAWVETPFYLPGSKLKPAALSHQGIRTQFFVSQFYCIEASLFIS